MMKVIFTKNLLPLSKLIRWGFKQDCSHLAVLFDDKLVYHSNLLGVQLNSARRFLAHSDVVHSIDYSGLLSLEEEEEIYLKLTDREGKWYDLLGFLYFGIRAIGWRFFGMEIPSKNKWGSKEAFLCTEIAEAFPDKILPRDKIRDLGMKSPGTLFPLMIEKLKEFKR